MPSKLTIPERYKRARKAAGLSQDGAARAIGCSKGTVQTWESGDRVPGEARLIVGAARAYGVSADYLLGLTDDPAPHQGRDAGATSPDAEAAPEPESLEDARQLRGAKRLAAGAAEEAGRRPPRKSSRTGDQKAQ